MNKEAKKIYILFFAANTFIAVIGAIRIFYATQWGVWAFSDSASYFSAARNLIQGQGMIIKKVTGGIDYYQLFPPFYPMVLGVSGWLTKNYFTAARWINIITFGFFLFISGLVLFNQTKKPLISLIAPALLLVSPMMVADFTGAMTEPIFLMMMMLSFLVFSLLIKEPNISLTFVFILATSLMPITRYVGIVFIFTNFIFLIFFIRKPLKMRILFSSIITFFSSIPILAWFFYLQNVTGRIGGRGFQFNASLAGNFFDGLKIVYDVFKTFLPYNGLYENVISTNTRFILLLAVFIFLISASISILLKRPGINKSNEISLNNYLLFPVNIIAFILFIGFSYSITNRSYVIDHRQISPLIPMIIITSLLSFSVLISSLKFPRVLLKIGILCIYAFIFRYYFFTSGTLVRDLHENGYGYTARQYQESGIVEAIKQIPPDMEIISNMSGFILLHDNRLPIQVDQFHSHMYGSGAEYGESKFRNKRAALVLLRPDFNNYYGAQAEELYASLTGGLEVAYQDKAGAIYYFPD